MCQTTLTYYDPNHATTVVSGIINHFLDNQNFSQVQRYQLMKIKPDIKIIVRKPTKSVAPQPAPPPSPIKDDSTTTTEPSLQQQPIIHSTPQQTYRYEYVHREVPIRLAVTLFENYEMVMDEDDGLIMYVTLADTITGQAVAEMLVWVMALVQTGKVPELYGRKDVEGLVELRSAAEQLDMRELAIVVEMRLKTLLG